MKIIITQRADTGRTDDWVVSSIGLARQGIGKTQDEAIASLVRSNLEAFGITEIEQDVLSHDRDAAGERIRKTFTWRAEGTEA